MPHFRAVDADRLPRVLADDIAALPGVTRVAIDGPLCARPHELAAALADPLRALGRPVVHVRAEAFWRDASLRLEYGHTDVRSYLHDWLDVGALRRELLDPLGPGGSGLVVASLRDPLTNRATREPRRQAEPRTVLIVSGELLLGHGLPFDRTIHLSVSAPARARRTPQERAWTLAAFEIYDEQTAPAEHADIVVKLDDPRHPAVRPVIPR